MTRSWPPEHPGPLDYAEAAVFAGPLLLLAGVWWIGRQIAVRTAACPRCGRILFAGRCLDCRPPRRRG